MSESKSAPRSEVDGIYRLERDKIEAYNTGAGSKPWLTTPRHFTKVKVSAVAALKMMSHAKEGVEKGLKSKNAMPIEIMGLMIGNMDPDDPHGLVVMDVFPLPVEGTETLVLTSSDEVLGYMTRLSDSLEKTRDRNIMGWYHSHPFDVGTHSNCFLSGTDVSTQMGWQLSEDRAGNPWLAIVVDPLRSVALGRIEIGAFRCYPNTYTAPHGLAPDGVVWEDERARNARWGEACVSYYELGVEFFMSTMSSALLGVLSRGFLWTRVLSSTPMLEKETRDRVAKQLGTISDKLSSVDSGLGSYSGGSGAATGGDKKGSSSELVAEAVQMSREMAVEHLRGEALQAVKHHLFNALPGARDGDDAMGGDAAGAGGSL